MRKQPNLKITRNDHDGNFRVIADCSRYSRLVPSSEIAKSFQGARFTVQKLSSNSRQYVGIDIEAKIIRRRDSRDIQSSPIREIRGIL